ncbi:putative bacteriocin export ABC transporter [Xylocopilactobacillus apis]|uniref:ABC transporter ATP-binding protein n=1 Tax=Xylocopilactobacillus apis TaxID=2932183 RepID=A0AAU9DFK0_9LACO|nr:putative bacteriocin export ABC transporter [Xylocopilactobacillus apis]BDR57031.1 ABC transporter ATP-binding protein [Xylocopilactobacillus apis]
MIKLKNITKRFPDKTIFQNFDFQFDKGKSYALIGPSGSGKTTLLNIIGKLENPVSGEVYIEQSPLKKIKEKDYFKSYISYLFQNFGLIDNESIKNNLDLAFIGKKINSNEKLKQMNNALEQVNLSLDLNRKIYSLSGGESQRVAIAKTILKDSPIVLADEPTASLDEKNSNEIIDLILQLKQKNKLIIIATHSPNVYRRLDEIVQINQLTNNVL